MNTRYAYPAVCFGDVFFSHTYVENTTEKEDHYTARKLEAGETKDSPVNQRIAGHTRERSKCETAAAIFCQDKKSNGAETRNFNSVQFSFRPGRITGLPAWAKINDPVFARVSFSIPPRFDCKASVLGFLYQLRRATQDRIRNSME